MRSVKPQVRTLKYVSFRTSRDWARLLDNHISLTYLGGNSFYTKEDSLKEIMRHHKPEQSYYDFSELIETIKGLPRDVWVQW